MNRFRVKTARVKSPTDDLSTQALIEAQNVVRVGAVKSADFGIDPSIKVTLDAWSESTDELESAWDELRSLISQTSIQRTKIGTLRARNILCGCAFGSTLESAVSGDPARLASFSVELKGHAGSVQPVVTPEELRVKPDEAAGRYTARWKPQAAAGIYEGQRTAGPLTASSVWVDVYSGKNASFSAVGIVGEELWFQVRAKGNEVSPWCPPVSLLVR